MNDILALKLKTLPESPGCYLMREGSEVLYVGKAKNLKNRVRQYFQAGHGHTPKVRAMVSRVLDFDILLCSTNLEALILESNLIKLHKPYYNILLRDDKQYPFIRVDAAQDFPRIEFVRRTQRDGAKYFGPYLGATSVREVLDLLRQIYPLRTCSLPLPDGKPHRPCIQHEIGNCLAPCAGKVSRDDYHEVLRQALRFLSGRDDEAIQRLREQMSEAALSFEYERAAILRDRLRAVEKLVEKQRAIKPGGGDYDALAVAQDGLDAMVQIMHIRGGQMLGGDSFALERAGDEDPGEVLTSFMLQFYTEAALIPPVILTSLPVDEPDTLSELLSEILGKKAEIASPARGEKRDLIDLALKNATDALAKRNLNTKAQYERTLGATASLAKAIGLAGRIRRMECYDISNTQGALSVASMVVFIDGKPAKQQYRHFRIKTVEGANDFASMEEALGRRFRHGLAEREERLAQGLNPEEGSFSDLPDLVVIDGGPEQLAFARRAMLDAGANAPICSLAKRLEEIFLPDREESILLNKRDPALQLMQRIRDEAHRFAITHHRHLRGKQQTKSQLEAIPGIGPARRRALLTHFRTMNALRAATAEELTTVPGMNKKTAEAVYEAMHGAVKP
ncbi:MAG: excinuclease ABC subunit UvrC [Oscillospiraceae bacterium]|jgi:excinuclease ABC subunit C|nr:excinuclease ABC subunit UvrC [Oscillospiraceae bacterium]